MSKAFSILMLALVLLGFLISTTMSMYGDMEQLKTENQKLARELTQSRSDYESAAQERDAVKAESADLHTKLDALQNAYLAENQARLKAESEVAAYKGMLTNTANNAQTTIPSTCIPTEQQAGQSGDVLLSAMVPVSAGSLITLAIAGLFAVVTTHYRKQRILRKLPTRLKDHQ